LLERMEFDGPRRISPAERKSGEELFTICFGHNLAGETEEQSADSETSVDGVDSGWYVMVPSKGPHAGKVVSQISIEHHQVQFGGGFLPIGSIGGVSTHPDFRGKGLAGQVLVHCTQRLKDEGARLMLISGGRGLYTRTGNVFAMRFNHYVLRTDEVRTIEALLDVRLRPAEREDAVWFSRLHQREPVHYLRKLEAYPRDDPYGNHWVIELDGTPTAYFMWMVPWGIPWDPDQGIRLVTEYGGGRLALTAGFNKLVTGFRNPRTNTAIQELRVGAPVEDVDLGIFLNDLTGQRTQEPLYGHTMRLINFDGLRQDLDAYINARLPEDLCAGLRFEQNGPLLVDPGQGDRTGDRCAIVWNDARLELSTGQMTQLVMGSWDFDIEDIESPLDEIVEALFPLPSFTPGINYR